MPKPAGWFFDSVTLSNFALTGHLDLLQIRYRHRLFITTQVMDELAAGVSSGYSRLAECLECVDRGFFKAIVLDKTERDSFLRLITNLGQGEAATIAAASHRHGVVVTDDLAARRACRDFQVPFTGTLGILQAMMSDGSLHLDAANTILREMIEVGFHSSVNRFTASS